jgi:small conductance mechanosensitive channel
MEESVQKIQEMIATYGLSLIAGIIIFVVGKWLSKWLSGVVEKILSKTNVDPTLTKFAKNCVYSVMMIFVILAALSKIGIQTTSFIAVIGAAGLAVGMALQGSLANFAAGILIVFFRPYKVDDFISAGGISGTVKEVQIFNTVLATPDNVRVIIPNAQVTSGSISNFSHNPTRRIDLVASISYGDDIAKAKQVLKSVLEQDSRVLKDPSFKVAVSEMGESSVNLIVRPWVNASEYWDVRFDLVEKIKLALEANGLNIPFPQRDIHIISQTEGLNAQV